MFDFKKDTMGVVRKKRGLNPKLLIIILIAILVCVASVFLVKKFFFSKATTQAKKDLTVQQTDKTSGTLSPKEIFDKVSKSVVMIVAYDDSSKQTASVGSGVIMNDSGYIITASHVVNDSTETNLTVSFYDESKTTGTVIGIDKQTDLAVVKVSKDGLTPAEFGNSDQASIGDWVLSLGNPGTDSDIFDYSLTRGIISSKDRTVNASKTTMKYIQTDAAISSGSSGGALINMYGQVIGINALRIKKDDVEGICFAAQINEVSEIINELVDSGSVTSRAKLGIYATILNSGQAKQFKVKRGLIIGSISAESTLANTDVEVNDIITAIDGKKITSMKIINDEIEKHSIGDSVTLTIYRRADDLNADKTFKVTAELIEGSDNMLL